MPSYSSILEADGRQYRNVGRSAVSLTLPDHFSTSGVSSGRARIQIQKAPLIYLANGQVPTAGDPETGHVIGVGKILVVTTLAEMRNLRFVRAGAKDGAISVQYDRRVN